MIKYTVPSDTVPLFTEQGDAMSQEYVHKPVMEREVCEYLRPSGGMCMVDCTIGMGGHAGPLLEAMGSDGRLIGIDRDSESLALAKKHLQHFGERCVFIHSDFRYIDSILNEMNIPHVDGMLFDLGISSYQLENAQRGFSIKVDGPLDMRMDQETYISAYDLINSLSEKEISYILRNYGQERWHHLIAHQVVVQRAQHPLESTKELAGVVMQAIPARRTHQKIHPATRTFQALRIAVNRELEALECALDKCLSRLSPGGRICVISFHSLEDKIVKEKFRYWGKMKMAKVITKKPLRPTEQETKNNPRARSARLRVTERL